jgi:acetyl-CoA decarbonylase/synthase complex subunit gamma
MPLSGLQIYKLLPKTNCKECGFPTCMAFAMKLAAQQAELSACPHVTEDAKQQLASASQPPIRLITLGAGNKKIEVGNETVLFRHEKTFFHPPALAIRLKDTLPADEFKSQVSQIAGYTVERVGLNLGVSAIAIENASGNGATFAGCAEIVKNSGLTIILMAEDAAAMEAAASKVAEAKPLLYAAGTDNWQAMASVAKKLAASLVVYADGELGALAELTEKVKGAGVEDIVLDPGARDPHASLVSLTQIRRLALKKQFRPLGYPVITFPGEGAASAEEEAILASQQIAKYGSIIVLNHFDPAVIYPLLTLRLNIYTDPQKPIQVSPGLYEINNPKPGSPLLVTTNFSLTYFTVAGEVEGSGVPVWLLITDAEGLSVLTAWAAGKFDAEKIAKAVKQFGVEGKLDHKKIVIPGLVAVLSGDLEEELPGWEIRVGPREAIDLPAYLKNVWK